MFKNIFIFFMLSVLSSVALAEPRTGISTNQYKLPETMKNCTIYTMIGSNFTSKTLYVTHCPDAKTETQTTGKFPVHVISGDVNSSSVNSETIDLNGDKYISFDSVSNIDFNKVIELNGKKYVKLK